MLCLIEFLKNRYFIWILSACLAVHIVSILISHYDPGWMPDNDYILCHYLISYDLGFISRALIGTIYQKSLYFISSKLFFLIFLILQTGLFYLITFYFYSCVRKNNFSEGTSLLFVSYLLTPPIYLIFHDLGRFDIILLGLFFLCFTLIWYHKWAASVIVPCLMGLGVLIHEGFIFYYIPLLLAWSLFFVKPENKKSFILPAFIIFGSCISIYLLFLMRQNVVCGNEISAYIASKNHFSHIQLNTSAFESYAGESGKSKSFFNHFHCMFEMLKDGIWINFIVSFFVFCPCCILPCYIFKQITISIQDKWEKYKVILLGLACLSPLGLSLIGIDFGRWTAAAFWCIYITIFSLLRFYSYLKINIPQKLLFYQFFVLAMICSSSSSELAFNHICSLVSHKLNQIITLLI